MERIIKLILSFVFLLCLAPMPHGYYLFVRLAALVGFGILASFEYERGRVFQCCVYVALLLLYQPFERVVLQRTAWCVIDLVVVAGLLGNVIFENRLKNK